MGSVSKDNTGIPLMPCGEGEVKQLLLDSTSACSSFHQLLLTTGYLSQTK